MTYARLMHSLMVSEASDFKGALPIGAFADDTPDEYALANLIDAVTTGATFRTAFLATASALVLTNKSTDTDAWAVLRSEIFNSGAIADGTFADADPDTLTDNGAGGLFAGWPTSFYARITGTTNNNSTYLVQSHTDDVLTFAAAVAATAEVSTTPTVACDVESYLHLPYGRTVIVRNFRPANDVVLYTASGTAAIQASVWGT